MVSSTSCWNVLDTNAKGTTRAEKWIATFVGWNTSWGEVATFGSGVKHAATWYARNVLKRKTPSRTHSKALRPPESATLSVLGSQYVPKIMTMRNVSVALGGAVIKVPQRLRRHVVCMDACKVPQAPHVAKRVMPLGWVGHVVP